jgi:tetratricopeptide (TPR) repeat protein
MTVDSAPERIWLSQPEQRARLMTAAEPLASYDHETQADESRINVVRLVDLLGPISPELVLVDPQLAAHARALLPDLSITGPPLPPERAISVASSPIPSTSRPVPSRRTIPWTLLGACAVTAVVVSAVFGTWTTLTGDDGGAFPQPSAEAGPTFFTTPPVESDLAPDELAALEENALRQPRSPKAREALGNAYFELGRPRDAEAEFRALVELSPSDDFAHYALGRALADQGRHKEAALQFKLAGSLSEGRPSARLP